MINGENDKRNLPNNSNINATNNSYRKCEISACIVTVRMHVRMNVLHCYTLRVPYVCVWMKSSKKKERNKNINN